MEIFSFITTGLGNGFKIFIKIFFFSSLSVNFGFFKGIYMCAKRILSCHPIKFLGGGEGFDPIKKKIKIKK